MDSSRNFTEGLDDDDLFAYELRVKKFLTSFGIDEGALMKNLSGGEVKRVALTVMLASEADFYIMDEPTNHLDIDAIEFLENYLGHSRSTLLMVTHDRYFLDHVCNTVMELDHGAVYTYRGNYENYLENARNALTITMRRRRRSIIFSGGSWSGSGVRLAPAQERPGTESMPL